MTYLLADQKQGQVLSIRCLILIGTDLHILCELTEMIPLSLMASGNPAGGSEAALPRGILGA